MAVTASLALLLGALAGPGTPAPVVEWHLSGLERIYFEKTDRPIARAVLHRTEVEAVLPEFLSSDDDRFLPATMPAQLQAEIEVHDFALPWSTEDREVLLRQVIDRGQRIQQVWWALYDRGLRVETWFFEPAPERTEGKSLAGVEVEAVATPAPNRLVLKTCGLMVRPQGSWWARGQDLLFSVEGNGLRLDGVRDRFSIFQDYDRGDGKEAGRSVVSWQVVSRRGGERLEERSYRKAPPEVLKRCGAEDVGACDALEAQARCVTRDPRAQTTEGPLDQGSFIERGVGLSPKPR